jgi:hypothetical protein
LFWQEVFVGFSREFCFGSTVPFQVFEVFEEEDPGGLLYIIQFTGTPSILVQDVIDVLEGLLKHGVNGFISQYKSG